MRRYGRQSTRRCSGSQYETAFLGDSNWQTLPAPDGDIYVWDEDSTYIKKPPYFDNMVDPSQPIAGSGGIAGAGDAGRFGDDGSHFARGFDCGEQSGREIFARAGREAGGFQFLWGAARGTMK